MCLSIANAQGVRKQAVAIKSVFMLGVGLPDVLSTYNHQESEGQFTFYRHFQSQTLIIH